MTGANLTGMIDEQSLNFRIEANIALMSRGEDLIHTFSEAEIALLRSHITGGFGVRPDGQIAHCGNAVADLSELELLIWNNELLIRTGFPPRSLNRLHELLKLRK